LKAPTPGRANHGEDRRGRARPPRKLPFARSAQVTAIAPRRKAETRDLLWGEVQNPG
jgi:hypothetical protein